MAVTKKSPNKNRVVKFLTTYSRSKVMALVLFAIVGTFATYTSFAASSNGCSVKYCLGSFTVFAPGANSRLGTVATIQDGEVGLLFPHVNNPGTQYYDFEWLSPQFSFSGGAPGSTVVIKACLGMESPVVGDSNQVLILLHDWNTNFDYPGQAFVSGGAGYCATYNISSTIHNHAGSIKFLNQGHSSVWLGWAKITWAEYTIL